MEFFFGGGEAILNKNITVDELYNIQIVKRNT